MTTPTMIDVLIPTQYQLSSEVDNKDGLPHVCFDRQISPYYPGMKWAVRRGGNCLRKDGLWEHEPQPSSRDDAFYAMCRFDSLEEAVTVYTHRSELGR